MLRKYSIDARIQGHARKLNIQRTLFCTGVYLYVPKLHGGFTTIDFEMRGTCIMNNRKIGICIEGVTFQ